MGEYSQNKKTGARKNQKTIIYSNWIEFGIEPVEKTLDDLGIQYKTISGKTSRK